MAMAMATPPFVGMEEREPRSAHQLFCPLLVVTVLSHQLINFFFVAC
jgi:hypothetical protein